MLLPRNGRRNGGDVEMRQRDDFPFWHRHQLNLHEVGGDGSLHDFHAVQLANAALSRFLQARTCDLPRLGTAPYFSTRRVAIELNPPIPFDSWLEFGVRVASLAEARVSFQVVAYRPEADEPALVCQLEWEQRDEAGNPVPLTAAQIASLTGRAT